MTAFDTLITPNEVRLNALVGAQMDTAQMNSVIVPVEEGLFNDYFGSDFYDTLLADLVDYSSAALFAANTVYTAGGIVKLNGIPYTVIQTTTGSQIPGQNSDYFSLAPKFATSANEYLWHRYLVKILAQSVANTFAIPSAIKQTEKGIVRLKDDDFDPATSAEIATFKQNYYELVRANITAMEKYVLRNPASYPTYKLVQDAANNSSCEAEKGAAETYRKNTFGFVLPDPERNRIPPYFR